MSSAFAIPLQVHQPEIQSPVQTIGGLMQLRGQMADIALRQQQQNTSAQQEKLVAEETAQKQRNVESTRVLQELLHDTKVGEAVGRGDFQPIWNAGVSPDVAQPFIKNIQDMQASSLKLSEDKAKHYSSGRELLARGIEGLDEKDDTLAAEQFAGLKSTIGQTYPELAQSLPTISPGPDFRSQLKQLAGGNAIARSIFENDLAQRKVKAETAASDANAQRATAEVAKFNQDVATAQASLPKVEAEAEAARLLTDFKKANGGKTPAEVETARHDLRTEAVQAGELGLKQKTFEATFGSGLDANGQPLSQEALKAAAAADPTTVAISEYRVPPPSATLRSGAPNPMLRKVTAINPGYDATKYAERNKVQQDFSAAGASGKAITSADTALAHLDAIDQAGKALDNGDLVQLNRLANFLGAQTGSSAPVVYDTIVGMVAPEISKAVIGAAGGVAERGEMAHNFSRNVNQKTRQDAIAAAAGLLGARVHKQAQAFESSMGTPLDLTKRLSPESQALLKRYQGGGNSGHSVGDVVSIPGQGKIKITAIHGDGTFDGDPVK